jgi:hypothetical protein
MYTDIVCRVVDQHRFDSDLDPDRLGLRCRSRSGSGKMTPIRPDPQHCLYGTLSVLFEIITFMVFSCEVAQA